MPGRKPQPPQPGTRVSLGLKVTPDIKTKLDGSAQESGRTQSQEAEARLERSFGEADALDRAMVLAYGADNGPLLHLIGEVLRVVTPYGGWLNEEAAVEVVSDGLAHLLNRLRAPSDVVVADDGVERRIDSLLFDLGYDGSEHRPSDNPRARWAAEKRKRFGIYGPRLVQFRKAATKELLAREPREMAKSAPADAASWDRIIAEINARKQEGEGA
jgi:hypothetical protein